MVVPISLAVLYCVLMNVAIFTTISYGIELVVNLVAIIIYRKTGETE